MWAVVVAVLLLGCSAVSAIPSVPKEAAKAAAKAPPNIIIIIADDLGWGDLSVSGHPTIATPNIDAIARNGTRLTSFYCGSPRCTPSRTGLLTGRYAVRSGMAQQPLGVAYPSTVGGLPESERTLATLLRSNGYSTKMIGKYHLGHVSPHRWSDHGFDEFFGLPYSNDMGRGEYSPLPLYRNDDIIAQPIDQSVLPQLYSEELVSSVEAFAATGRPFFLIFSPHQPHVPLITTPASQGRSVRGPYGDVVEEADDLVGDLMATVERLGLASNTVTLFTSDNGPWLTQGLEGGSAGLLRDGKGTPFEGGNRVPGFWHWPGRIPAGRIEADYFASFFDVLPTMAEFANVTVPEDRLYDGKSIAARLLHPEQTSHRMPTSKKLNRTKEEAEDEFFFYVDDSFCGVRVGEYKVLYGCNGVGSDTLLFNINVDPSEFYPIDAESEEYAEVLPILDAARDRHLASVVAVPNQLVNLDPSVMPCCNPPACFCELDDPKKKKTALLV